MALRKKSDGAAATNGRARVEDLEAAQDRSYWLDRWGLDLNALMRKPGARRLRALLRWLRELQRGRLAVQRYAQTRLGDLRESAVEDEIAAGAETAGDDSPTARS